MNTLLHVPPGFRFHPTDEELVDYYLRKKIYSRRIDLDVIKDVELYKIEPWDLQDKVDCKLYLRQRLLLIIDDLVLIANEICNVGREDEKEWYIFSHKDKKYPTGSRTNRATRAGFWKATGRDKAIHTKHSELIIGMRKTLVYYKGRAPNGQKSDWIMHEYRLQTHENDTPQEKGWVVCRVFKKRIAIVRGMNEHESPCWYDEPMSFMPDLDSPNQSSLSNFPHHNLSNFPCKKEVDHNLPYQNHFLHLPILESQKLLQSVTTATSSMPTFALDINQQASSFEPSAAKPPNIDERQQQLSDQNMFLFDNNNNNDELTDWGVFDKYVASQLSQENALKQEFIDPQNAPTSTSSSQIEMWK